MDPQQQNQLVGMIASMGIVFGLIGICMAAFFVFLFWRIFTKAGMAGPLALISLFPVFGPIIVLCILAFSQWRVTPNASGYAGTGVQPYPPAYPPQAYPPSNYPPAGPPTQL